MSRYNKFLASLSGPVLAAITAALTDGDISKGEWWAIASALFGSLAVYLAPPNDYTTDRVNGI